MTTQYVVDQVTKGVNGFGLPFCDTVFTCTLTAATDTTVSVPLEAAVGMGAVSLGSTFVPGTTSVPTSKNKYIAVMSYTPSAKVYVAKNATAAIPAGATFAASTSELNPLAKYVQSGDVLHFFCAAGADVSVAFYAIQA